MGSWGPATFEDDIACDWLGDLHESDPIAFFVHCLDLEDLQYVEHLACIGVVCTAEMVHSLTCQPRAGLPEVAYRWLKENQGLDVVRLIPDTIAGLHRVLGPDSEMHEMWEDSGHLHIWEAKTSDLLRRLESVLANNR